MFAHIRKGSATAVAVELSCSIPCEYTNVSLSTGQSKLGSEGEGVTGMADSEKKMIT